MWWTKKCGENDHSACFWGGEFSRHESVYRRLKGPQKFLTGRLSGDQVGRTRLQAGRRCPAATRSGIHKKPRPRKTTNQTSPPTGPAAGSGRGDFFNDLTLVTPTQAEVLLGGVETVGGVRQGGGLCFQGKCNRPTNGRGKGWKEGGKVGIEWGIPAEKIADLGWVLRGGQSGSVQRGGGAPRLPGGTGEPAAEFAAEIKLERQTRTIST